MGPIGCPETSVQNYLSTMRNIPEECRYVRRGGSLKSRVCENVSEGAHVYGGRSDEVAHEVAVGSVGVRRLAAVIRLRIYHITCCPKH
jgi:hypothetical protein